MPYVENCPILALNLSDFLNSYVDFLPDQDQKSNFLQEKQNKSFLFSFNSRFYLQFYFTNNKLRMVCALFIVHSSSNK